MPGVSFRKQAEPADADVVRRSHVAHRRSLLGAIPWPPDALTKLCEQQHELQERHIAVHERATERLMIVTADRTVGRICISKEPARWRIVDLAVLPGEQGRGVGTAALTSVLAEAAASGAVVELRVGLDNPRAEALYRRLGFVDEPSPAASERRLAWNAEHAIS